MTELTPLPSLPERVDPAALPQLGDDQLEALVADLGATERATIAAMAPHQALMRELRARSGEIATERRRRERAAHIAARAAVRAQAKSGEMPSIVDALALPRHLDPATPLAGVSAYLKSGGEVRFGYPSRPGELAFSDGRQVRSARTWGEAQDLYAGGWEPGAPGVPGIRVHLAGSRVERVVSPADVVIGVAGSAPATEEKGPT